MESTSSQTKPKITPKDFFLWAGAMIALYASVIAFISLLFDYLNYALPDVLNYYPSDPYSSGISYEMASLIVFFPLFLVLMRSIRNSIVYDPSRTEIWVRRWAIHLTLFVAGLTLAGDLVTLIMYFLNGDVTLRFLLKILVVLLVVGGVFLHFLADLRGYWQRNPDRARIIGIAVGILAVVSILGGFFIVGTPWQARLYRFDEQKINNLQQIQSEIVSYWQAKQKLPTTLADLVDSVSGFTVPVDPQTNEPYEYQVTGIHSFKLCATFNAKAQQYALSVRPAALTPGYPAKTSEDTWNHQAGHVCFTRTIDPERHPPLSK